MLSCPATNFLGLCAGHIKFERCLISKLLKEKRKLELTFTLLTMFQNIYLQSISMWYFSSSYKYFTISALNIKYLKL